MGGASLRHPLTRVVLMTSQGDVSDFRTARSCQYHLRERVGHGVIQQSALNFSSVAN